MRVGEGDKVKIKVKWRKMWLPSSRPRAHALEA